MDGAPTGAAGTEMLAIVGDEYPSHQITAVAEREQIGCIGWEFDDIGQVIDKRQHATITRAEMVCPTGQSVHVFLCGPVVPDGSRWRELTTLHVHYEPG